MLPLAIGLGALSAFGAFQDIGANNRAMGTAIKNAERRYLLKSEVSEAQMVEQQQVAREKMTDVARQFLVAKGRAKAIQAETGAGGKLVQVQEFQLSSKESEIKGDIARQVDVNIINIAQNMLASKMDTEALIAEAESRKKTGLSKWMTIATMGLAGASTGNQLGSMLGSDVANINEVTWDNSSWANQANFDT